MLKELKSRTFKTQPSNGSEPYDADIATRMNQNECEAMFLRLTRPRCAWKLNIVPKGTRKFQKTKPKMIFTTSQHLKVLRLMFGYLTTERTRCILMAYQLCFIFSQSIYK